MIKQINNIGLTYSLEFREGIDPCTSLHGYDVYLPSKKHEKPFYLGFIYTHDKDITTMSDDEICDLLKKYDII